jgi:hypothetical protein
VHGPPARGGEVPQDELLLHGRVGVQRSELLDHPLVARGAHRPEGRVQGGPFRRRGLAPADVGHEADGHLRVVGGGAQPVGARPRGRTARGDHSSATACGNRTCSRRIASAGRAASVSTALTWWPSTAACSAPASSCSRVPVSWLSGRCTGASTRSTRTPPAASSSTSQLPLRWLRSENENATGEPL